MKRSLFFIVSTWALLAFLGCDQKNNRSAQIRQPFYGQGYYFNQPYYQYCGQPGYQYTNPYNGAQINCQYVNGLPQFYYNNIPYPNDIYGNPCLDGNLLAAGYCNSYYYPYYNYIY